ncbi:YitT family protein [uncultured Cohaesibacter sp.]|uniref:YitT family protein n=1 Tax=uncultured Cohaesibacter sp. TaxID=1002546 RepID=UPI0029309A1E|nr:YitT family protein [uncultured Cohaesibacter sp.]
MSDQPAINDSDRHSLLEDLQGLAFGVFTCALGMVFLTQLGFLTGQTAGLALLISYISGVDFGTMFFLVNIPFYWFTYHRMGLRFTIKSVLCVVALSVTMKWLPPLIQFDHLDPLAGMLAFGTSCGAGLLAIIRHEGSLGGAGAMAVTIQEFTGFKAGYAQQLLDLVIFGSALFYFPWQIVAWSIFGSVIVNAIIAINHRRDRYIGR